MPYMLVDTYKKIVELLPLIFWQSMGIIGTKLIKHSKTPMKISTEVGIFPRMSPKPSKYGFGGKSHLLVSV